MGKARNKNGPLRQCFSNLFRAYQCHNTKHAHVPLSQYKTLHVPLGIASITACFQDTGLPESFAVETSDFAVAALLIQRHLTT
jgi:hypothetical protein